MTRPHRTFSMIPIDWATNPPPKAALQAWIVIWDNTDARGLCMLSQGQIMDVCGLSRSSVRQALAWLEGCNAIKVISGSGRAPSSFRVVWHNAKPAPKYNALIQRAVDAQKSNPQRVGKVTPRGSEKCAPGGSKSNPLNVGAPLSLKNTACSIQNKERTNKTRAKARARGCAECRLISDADLRLLVLNTAKQAHREGSRLPGTDPPRPRKLSADHNKKTRALWHHLHSLGPDDVLHGYGEPEAALFEFWRRCYFRPWHRGLSWTGDEKWRPDSFIWFINRWENHANSDRSADQLRKECAEIATKRGMIGSEEQTPQQLLQRLLPDE